MSETNSGDEKEKPWLETTYDESEHGGHIIGNRAGLEHLITAVEQALADGQSRLDVDDGNLRGITLHTQRPVVLAPVKKAAGLGDAIACLGCAFVVLIFVAGLAAVVAFVVEIFKSP